MTEIITTGVWIVPEAKQPAFVAAWSTFAGWASGMSGAAKLRLGRDASDPTRFVSFAPWASPEQAHAWKAHAEFRERMAQVLQHVTEFHPSELDLVSSAAGGVGSPLEIGATR